MLTSGSKVISARAVDAQPGVMLAREVLHLQQSSVQPSHQFNRVCVECHLLDELWRSRVAHNLAHLVHHDANPPALNTGAKIITIIIIIIMIIEL